MNIKVKTIYHLTIPISLAFFWSAATIQGKVVYGSISLFNYLLPTVIALVIGGGIGYLHFLRSQYKISSEQFRDVADVAQEFIYLRHINGQYGYVSPSCLNITGYDTEDFYSTPNLMDQIIFKDDQNRWEGHVHRINDGSSPESFDIRIITKTGKLVWINHTCLPIYDEAGKQTGVRSTNFDITKRRNQEEQLNQASILYNNTTESVVITNPEGIVIATNKAFTDITGYEESEVVGGTPSRWKSDKHEQSFYQNMWHELLETDQWRGEICNRRKDGEVYPALLTINAVRNKKQKLTHFVSLLTDLSSIKKTQEKIEFLAHHDSLTRLPNRLLFSARLEQAISRADREKEKIAVLFLDLDNFKSINDSLGHSMGDKVLQKVAGRLTILIREQDTIARLSGDEFAIVLEQIDDETAAAHVAKKILDSIQQPIHIGSHEFNISVTIGISQFPDNGIEIDTLIKNADAAMYKAKEKGKGQYCFYTKELTERANSRMKIESLLRRALDKNEFTVNYQPQYEAVNDRMFGCEALLRWKNDELGAVSPNEFIPIAESTGLIIKIGEWVLTESCRQAKSWIDSGYLFERISVNVSGQQITHSDIVNTVKSALEKTGLEAQNLELEITESVIMEQPEKAIGTLEKLKEIGISLAIDDFGTGYSSLSYLKLFPINKLKIDRSFIKDIQDNDDDVAIVQAIIALSKSLDLSVIAEGVEKEEQQKALIEYGCDEIQGFLHSKPANATEITKMLNSIQRQNN